MMSLRISLIQRLKLLSYRNCNQTILIECIKITGLLKRIAAVDIKISISEWHFRETIKWINAGINWYNYIGYKYDPETGKTYRMRWTNVLAELLYDDAEQLTLKEFQDNETKRV